MPLIENKELQFFEIITNEDKFSYFEYSTYAHKFVSDAYDSGWIHVFSWQDWQNSDEGKLMYNDRDYLSKSDIDKLIKLLTSIIRCDRFVDGHLALAYNSGLLSALIKRAIEVL